MFTIKEIRPVQHRRSLTVRLVVLPATGEEKPEGLVVLRVILKSDKRLDKNA